MQYALTDACYHGQLDALHKLRPIPKNEGLTAEQRQARLQMYRRVEGTWAFIVISDVCWDTVFDPPSSTSTREQLHAICATPRR